MAEIEIRGFAEIFRQIISERKEGVLSWDEATDRLYIDYPDGSCSHPLRIGEDIEVRPRQSRSWIPCMVDLLEDGWCLVDLYQTGVLPRGLRARLPG